MSAHAVAVTFAVLAAAALDGGVLALVRALAARPAGAPVSGVPRVAAVPARDGRSAGSSGRAGDA